MKNFTLSIRKVAIIFGTLLLTNLSYSQTPDYKVQHIQDDVANTGGTNTGFTAVSSLNNAVALANNNRKSNAGRSDENAGNLEGDDMAGARRLTNTSTLTYYREGGSLNNNMRFNTSIWEYIGAPGGNNEMIVRGRYAVTLNGTTNSVTQALSGITNANDCIPFITGIMNNSSIDDSDSGTAIAYLENATTLRVQKGSNANNVTIYVTVVEFTGSNWTVLHGDSGSSSLDTGTITVRDGSDGTGTVTNVSAWSEAIIFTHHRGDMNTDNTDVAIADNWPVMDPGSNNQTADWAFNGAHDGTNRHFIHVLNNSGLNVTRYQDTNNATGESTINITSAGLTDVNQALIVGSSTSSGTGTAYGRGWRNYYLNSTTQAAHWTHRSGNTMSHEIQIIDLVGLNTPVVGPEINITGLGNTINDGDTTPITTDDTDFGSVDITAGTNANIFTIQNTGTVALNLTGSSPYVVISGTNAADFTLTANPTTPIASSGSTTYTITFNPSAVGLRTATLSIANDDSDENPYNFDIQGTGTTPSYCTSNGDNTDGFNTGTRQVIFNTINNSTPIEDNDYSDFTGLSTTVTQSTAYNLTVNANTDGNYTTHTFAWIDWNQDSDFDDAGESYDLGTTTNSTNGATTLSPLSITIPGTATLGNTRMRISTKYNADPTNCETGFDGEVEDYTINVIASTPLPEINIQGNATTIVDGDTTPAVGDDTDFGNADITVGTVINTFTIQNTGTALLTLTGASPYVVISGTNAADFSVTTTPSNTVAASGSTTFNITFNPSAIGLRTATLTIANDDSDENPYNFDIQGTGTTTLPEINIQGNAIDIADGDTTPVITDNTDFGNVDIAGGTNANTFTIQNTGISLNLNLTGAGPTYVAISGTNAADFTVTSNPTTPIASAGSTTYTITFNPSALGLRTATLTIANDDSDENPYNFDIQGTGYVPPPCGSTVIHTADFESGLDGWTDGGVDAARVLNAGRSYSNSYSLEIRSLDAAGSNSSFDSPLYNLSTYDKIDFKFFFTAYNVENAENFFIEYSSDSGATWTVVSDYICNDVISKDADYESTNTIIFYAKTSTLLKTNYSFPNTSTSQFRVRSDASDTSDLVYIDNITITGTSFCTPTIGPGGITSNLDLWLKADRLDGSSIGTDGATVSKWTDNGKGNHAETVVSGQEPVYRNSVARNFNYNPVIDFENDNNTAVADMTYISARDELKGTAGFNSNDIFMVIMPDPTITTGMLPLDTFTSTDPTGTTAAEDVTGFGYGSYTQRLTGEYFTYCIGTSTGTPIVGYGRGDTSGSNNYNKISIINTRHNSGATEVELYLNANQVGTTSNDIPDFAATNDTRFFLGRSQYWNGSFDGRIAEVITYSVTNGDISLTDARNRIQSYLAVKYGITLGVNGTSQDYVDSDGTVIWDQSVNSGYNYDIASIGRDDASELNQKQSSSVNNATDGTGPIEGILSIGLTDLYTTNSDNVSSNPTVFNDKEFLSWGNNGADLDLAASVITVNMSAGITPSLTTNVTFTAMQRVWKVVENGGDIPKVKLSIPQNAIRNITPPGSFLMFISNTNVFDPTADYRVLTPDGSGNLETEYDFDGTKFITFGYAPQVIVERSVYFDGVVDYIDMEDALDLNATSFTVSAWIKRQAGSVNTSILSKRDNGYTEGYDFKIDGSGRIEMSWNGGSDNIRSNVSIPENEWHHVAVVFNSGTGNIYIDGVSDANKVSMAVPTATTQSFFIAAAGKNTPTAHFIGNIDEVRVWDTALSVDQLRFVMNQEIEDNATFVNGKEIPTSITKNDVGAIPWTSLAGYYPMSVYTYTNTNDESSNTNQGALRNLNTVDRQTAPLPYESTQNGDWDISSTWTNGSEQIIPGTASIADNTISVDWNIVRTTHNITINDDSDLPAGNNGNRSVLSLLIDNNTLTVDGSTASNTGFGITVTHYLNLDGNINLEGESQLIQTNDSDLDITSSGTLERDQQGTADTFTYNYWSSPVGVSNTISNNNSYDVTDVITAVNFLPTGFDGNASPVGIADYWIWKFANQPDDDYSAWQHIRSTGTILVGEGFTMKGPGTGTIATDQNYVLNGKPNNGDINLTINAGNDYLVGNPYPSAIDAEQFILDNGSTIAGTGATTGTLYFWEHWGGGSHYLADYQGGYATYNLSGGTPSATQGVNDPDVGTGGTPRKTPGRYIPVSQGFFVVAEGAGGTINFNNGQRIFEKEDGTLNGTSVFLRSATATATQSSNAVSSDPRMKFRIGFYSVNTIQRQLLLTVDDNATTGIDWGYDGKHNESQVDDMYWMIDNEKFTIQGSNEANTNNIYPLGIKTSTDGLNTISINALENVPSDVTVFVHDKDTNLYYNLNESDYQFFLPAGEYLNKFEITFSSDSSLSVDDDEIKTLDALYANDIESIVVLNPTLLEIKSIELFNLLGQSVHAIKNISESGYSEYEVKNLSTGTYIIKILTLSGSVSKKVLVK